ncbi:hypothetical protein DKX38_029905 [Salix brachista]|uniref:Uncharacterized protein n=1 Tax=Salix brachista TaxID=2182728 RepID=A0A5N5JCI3_9ROSI|nr:hypothetical protein DKX38_029905 [Salix brachista]
MAMRTRKIAPNMEAALASNDNRTLLLSIYKRSKKAQNAKPAKQKHLRMFAKPQGSFWRFYMWTEKLTFAK